MKAIEQQLVVMGIRSNPKLDSTANIVRVLIDMYVDIGDSIALQYGGSEAHKKVSTERESTIAGPMGKVNRGVLAMRYICMTLRYHGANNYILCHVIFAQHKELLTSIRRYYRYVSQR